MRQQIKSIICVLILLVLFFVNYSIADNNNDVSSFCHGDTGCIVDVIYEKKSNFELCEKSQNISTCYFLSAFYLNDSSICDMDNNLSAKKICYYKYAVQKNEIIICNLTDSFDRCVFEISINLDDFSKCVFAKDKGMCYYSYAVYKEDLNLCDLSEKYKKECIDRIVKTESININVDMNG